MVVCTDRDVQLKILLQQRVVQELRAYRGQKLDEIMRRTNTDITLNEHEQYPGWGGHHWCLVKGKYGRMH
jgi:hypothetical protein